MPKATDKNMNITQQKMDKGNEKKSLFAVKILAI